MAGWRISDPGGSILLTRSISRSYACNDAGNDVGKLED